MPETILICSGKGGVGKTTITAYLGRALSKNTNVALLDLDLACPNLPIILGMDKDIHVDVDLDHMYPKRFSNMEVFSSAFLIPNGVACTWNGSQRMNLVQELIDKVKWSPYDYMIVDLLPGSGDELMAAIQLMPHITGAVIVTNGKTESISDAKRLIGMLNNRMFSVPILGIVENMSYMMEEKEKKPLFTDGINIEEELGIPILDSIPFKTKNLTLRDFTVVKNKMLKQIKNLKGEVENK